MSATTGPETYRISYPIHTYRSSVQHVSHDWNNKSHGTEINEYHTPFVCCSTHYRNMTSMSSMSTTTGTKACHTINISICYEIMSRVQHVKHDWLLRYSNILNVYTPTC